MSDIVNVGLQKNGVDEPVPEKISEQGMALVCLLMREEDREIFQSGYEKKDGIYVLSSDRVEQKTQEVYEQSALTLMNLLKSSASQSGQTQSESDAIYPESAAKCYIKCCLFYRVYHSRCG